MEDFHRIAALVLLRECILIDLELLVKGWLNSKEIDNPPQSNRLDASHLHDWLTPRLELAGHRFAQTHPERIKNFIQQEHWVEDWALFSCLCADLNVYRWQDFPEPLKKREPKAIAKALQRLEQEIIQRLPYKYSFLNNGTLYAKLQKIEASLLLEISLFSYQLVALIHGLIPTYSY